MAFEHVVIALLSVMFLPFVLLLGFVIVLASFGTSLGIRKRYVALLLKIFEYGQTKIDRYNKGKANDDSDSEDDERIDDRTTDTDDTTDVRSKGDIKTTTTTKTTKPGVNDVRTLSGAIRTGTSPVMNPSQYLLSNGRSNGTATHPPEHSIHATGDALIDRATSFSLSIKEGIHLPYGMDPDTLKREFELADVAYFAKTGMEAVVDDNVTRCFTAEEISSWNLLCRTNYGIQYCSWRLTCLWFFGIVVRYSILFPFRLILSAIGIGWLIVCTSFIGCLPYGSFRRWLTKRVTLMCYRILARASSIIATFHNQENKASHGICVANHTSPMDVILLSADNCFSMVGQAHSGILGLVQRAMERAGEHIWFERSETKDRTTVAKRLKEHVTNPDKPPILIFPEGTCINNTSVMMFKKGSFEVADTIYPVAVKYDPRFGDAFWNSSKQSMMYHIFDILTSWALVVDVWYLPPMTRRENEDAVGFANRVKAEIARQGGLVDLEWDGQLKRCQVKDSWKSLAQEQYSKIIKSE